MILVPHEPDEEHLRELERFLEAEGLAYERYTDLEAELAAGSGAAPRQLDEETRVVLVDRVGVLATVYAAAQLAYIGGGFSSGVHNVMEPACFVLPVVFGPSHLNSREARLMVERGGAFAVNDREQAGRALGRLITGQSFRRRAGAAACDVVAENLGATARTLEALAGRYPQAVGEGSTIVPENPKR